MPSSRSPSFRPPRPADEASLDRTIEVFQPRTSRRLTRQDAREIQRNLAGCLSLLLEWDERRRNAVDGGER